MNKNIKDVDLLYSFVEREKQNGLIDIKMTICPGTHDLKTCARELVQLLDDNNPNSLDITNQEF